MTATIHGLKTVTVPIPHDPEQWVRVRTSLSPYVALQCVQERQREQMRAMGGIIDEIGLPAFNAGAALLDRGIRVEEVAARLNPDGTDAGANGEASVDGSAAADAGEDAPELTDEEREAAVQDAMRAQYDLDYGAFRMLKSWSLAKKVKLAHVRDLDTATRRWLQELAWERLRRIRPEELAGNS